MENHKMRSKLFKEFPSVNTNEWEERIKEDLKGADYEKRLIWTTPERFKIRPYYRQEDLAGKEYLECLPGEAPYIRGNNSQSNDWEIRQDILIDNIKTANEKSLFVLNRGITSLGFICHPGKEKNFIKSQQDFSDLLKDIQLEGIGLYFVGFNPVSEILGFLRKEISNRKIEPALVNGAIDYDPLGYLTFNGKYLSSENEDFNILKNLILSASSDLPNYKVLGINGFYFTNSGASVVQELGYSMAIAIEYLARMTDAEISTDLISHHLQFNFGVGSNYFMEIAKIRAARLLWARIAEAFKPSKPESMQTKIHSVTTEWNQTIYDPYVNVLRTTTESMAAILGGTDSLTVRPFTASYKPTTKFSGRIARNIQIILKEEAYLGNVIDPAAGSYYIENLTDSIINESWNIILKIEEEGGYLEALKKGVVQSDISATADYRKKMIATKKEILLGTNQYPNMSESMKDEIVPEIAFPPSLDSKLEVTPLKTFRGSMEFERIRLATENYPGIRPKVFLLTIGNPTMRKARATFSSNFFACAGYEIIDNPGFSTPEEGVQAALHTKANIIVLCSSDEEYAELAPIVHSAVGNKAILIVAGAPPCMNDLKAKGIENFIHVKSNLLESLMEYHQKLGLSL